MREVFEIKGENVVVGSSMVGGGNFECFSFVGL